jgi:NADPH:quinone reductase-like Zn-dependent oxidoreductase
MIQVPEEFCVAPEGEFHATEPAGEHDAEKVLIDARDAIALPPTMSFIEGAAITIGWLCAWHALTTVAEARAGQRVLIEAIASSVGVGALQIAKHLGCWVAGTASRDDKCARAREFGADAAYNYKTQQVSEEVRRDTGGYGIDIALMTIGEETASETIASMATDGKIVMYGSTGGRKITFDLGIGERQLALLSMNAPTSRKYYPVTMKTFRERAIPLFAQGAFKPIIDTVLPMSELAKAHRMVNERRHFGKIVMTL